MVPTWVGADTLTVPAAIGGGAMIGLQDLEPCAARACDAAGTKRLVFGDLAVEMEEAPVLVDVPFDAMVASFLIDNLTSFIDDNCRTHVAWTGLSAR